MLFIVDKYVTCVLHTDRDWVEEPIQKNVAVLHRRWISLRWGRKSKFISTHLQINILLKFHLLGDEKVSSLALVLAQFCLWTGEYHTPTNSGPQTLRPWGMEKYIHKNSATLLNFCGYHGKSTAPTKCTSSTNYETQSLFYSLVLKAITLSSHIHKKKIKIGYPNTGKLTLKNFDNSSVAMNESWFIEQH